MQRLIHQNLETKSWFDNEVNKIVSVSASIATCAFNKYFKINVEKNKEELTADMIKIYEAKYDIATFDSRAFNVPKEDVANCVLWRQQDATRNSIQQVAHYYFSNKELYRKNTSDIQDMLMEQYNINWNNYPTELKRGTACIRQKIDTGTKVRKKWVIDKEMPIITKDFSYIENLL